MDDLDAEIRSVFPEEQMITPDDVRGGSATLEDAVLTKGWPTARQQPRQGHVPHGQRGLVPRRATLAGHPSLEGRVLFTNSDPGQPDAAFLKRNDPTDPTIPGLVEQGYVVRTRSDADTVAGPDQRHAPIGMRPWRAAPSGSAPTTRCRTGP